MMMTKDSLCAKHLRGQVTPSFMAWEVNYCWDKRCGTVVNSQDRP